jgi:hypothetical protein
MSAGHRSPVWKHFVINTVDNSRVTCLICNKSLSRGGKVASSFTTSNMRLHLQRHHPTELAALTAVETPPKEGKIKPSSATPQLKQPTMTAMFDRGKAWAFDDPRSMRIHRLVGELIAVDDQPFNVVNNEAFRRLISALEPRYSLPSDSYLRKTLIPDMYTMIRSKVAELIRPAGFVSFTTDAWTTAQSLDSLMSLTAHWIDNTWERRSAILNASHVHGSHTAANIASIMTSMLVNWKLEDRVHVVLRDNAKNVTKGMAEAGVDSLGCFAHTLQLCVKRGLESQRAVDDAVAICRKIAGHFSHSTLAKEKLAAIQTSLPDFPQHSMAQDVTTRWSSTYYMVERIIEQKKALVTYSADNDIPTLSMNQWNLLEKTVTVLAPIEFTTRKVSADESSAADVIAMVVGLTMALKNVKDDSGVQTMKGEILADIATRFADVKRNKLYAVATLVDPRYRGKLFDSDSLRLAQDWLIEEATICRTLEP